MNTILVLDPGSRGSAELSTLLDGLRHDAHLTTADSSNDDLDYSTMVVLDDGSEHGLEATRMALARRAERPGLRVAVLLSLDASWSDTECLIRTRSAARRLSSGQLQLAATDLRQIVGARDNSDRLEVHIAPGAITFEYQA